jgi:hypothetical protein
MVTTTKSEWVADVVTMTCRNTTNNIVVLFEKLGKILNGKIQDIPLNLINEWRIEEKGGKNIRNTITEAEEIFLRAYSEENNDNDCK